MFYNSSTRTAESTKFASILFPTLNFFVISTTETHVISRPVPHVVGISTSPLSLIRRILSSKISFVKAAFSRERSFAISKIVPPLIP